MIMSNKISITNYGKKFLKLLIKIKLHEKVRLFYNDLHVESVFKIPSTTIVIKSLIEKNNKFYLELSINRCLCEI